MSRARQLIEEAVGEPLSEGPATRILTVNIEYPKSLDGGADLRKAAEKAKSALSKTLPKGWKVSSLEAFEK